MINSSSRRIEDFRTHGADASRGEIAAIDAAREIAQDAMAPCSARSGASAETDGDADPAALHDSHSNILQLAREMAASGQYRGWRSIEARLRADGLPRVREALDDADVRRELDHDCRKGRTGS